MQKQTADYTTTHGILDEIQASGNEFLATGDMKRAVIRVKHCDIAIKTHALNHIKERFQTIQMEKQRKLNLLKEDTF